MPIDAVHINCTCRGPPRLLAKDTQLVRKCVHSCTNCQCTQVRTIHGKPACVLSCSDPGVLSAKPLGSQESSLVSASRGHAAVWLRLRVVSVLAPGGGMRQPVSLTIAFPPAKQFGALGMLHKPQSGSAPLFWRTTSYCTQQQNQLPLTTPLYLSSQTMPWLLAAP